MHLNPPTPYFPTWKKSHAARNTFPQKHIQNVIIRQTGRPHMIVPGPTKKDGVIEIWKEQDRMIVRNGGALAADYKETQQTYEQAGEAPDGIAPSATNDRASGDTEEDASGNGGNETQPLIPPPKKKAVHVEQTHGQPRKSADTDKPSANTMNTTAQDKTDNHHQINAAGNANLGTNDDATNEAGGDVQAENDVQNTVMAASEADIAQPTLNEADDEDEHADTVKYALPAKIPSVNAMKADFRGKWSITFTNCSTRVQIEPIWKEIYQKYGPNARDLNLDYSNGSLQTSKGKPSLATTATTNSRSQKRKRTTNTATEPNKRPKPGFVGSVDTERSIGTLSLISEETSDVEMGGTAEIAKENTQNPTSPTRGSITQATDQQRSQSQQGLLANADPSKKFPAACLSSAVLQEQTQAGYISEQALVQPPTRAPPLAKTTTARILREPAGEPTRRSNRARKPAMQPETTLEPEKVPSRKQPHRGEKGPNPSRSRLTSGPAAATKPTSDKPPVKESRKPDADSVEDESMDEDENMDDEENSDRVNVIPPKIGMSGHGLRRPGPTHSIIQFPTRPKNDRALPASCRNGRELRAFCDREEQRMKEEAAAEGREYIPPDWANDRPEDPDWWDPWEGIPEW
jgi:hypothetical protein